MHKLEKNNPIKFEGLYGESAQNIIDEFVHLEPLVSRSLRNNWIIKLHYHRVLHQIFFIEQGSGVIFFENNKHVFAGPCIISVPENNEHGFNFEPNISGTVVSFSNTILDKIFMDSPQIGLEIGQIKVVEIKDQLKALSNLNLVIGQLNSEMEGTQPQQRIMIMSLLTSFLIEIYRTFKHETSSQILQKNRSLQIYSSFKKSIVQSKNPQKNIEEYASSLNITALHLNRICKEVQQKTATKVVSEFFMEEAKKYLTFTDYSISEVAFQLNFNDPAYFSRFFKKEFGQNPKYFRNEKKKELR